MFRNRTTATTGKVVEGLVHTFTNGFTEIQKWLILCRLTAEESNLGDRSNRVSFVDWPIPLMILSFYKI